MYLRNSWQVAAFSEELDKPTLARRIMDDAVLLFRTNDGISALEDLCPHRLAPLSAGRRAGDEIVCGYHGMTFGPDGVCTRMPGRSSIPATARVRRFPAVEQWGIVWIWMGNAELADPALLPDLHWLGQDEWRSVHGLLHVDADYRLINDNLLDLSHETYVHPTSVGNGQDGEEIAAFPVTIHDDGRVLCAERLMPDVAAQPGLSAAMGLGDRVDREQRAIYMAPSVNLTEGIMRSRKPGSNQAASHRILHLLTPEGPHSTHYFFIASRDYKLDDAAMDQVSLKIADVAFGEDKAMIECQQQSLNQHPGMTVPRIAWAIDKAPVRGRRMLEALVAAEQADSALVVRPGCLLGRNAARENAVVA